MENTKNTKNKLESPCKNFRAHATISKPMHKFQSPCKKSQSPCTKFRAHAKKSEPMQKLKSPCKYFRAYAKNLQRQPNCCDSGHAMQGHQLTIVITLFAFYYCYAFQKEKVEKNNLKRFVIHLYYRDLLNFLIATIQDIFILFQQNSISQKISIYRTYAQKIYTGYPNIGSCRLHSVHCLKKNLNLRIKIKPIPAGADVTLCVWFLGQIYCTVLYVQYINKSQSYVRVCIQYILLRPIQM